MNKSILEACEDAEKGIEKAVNCTINLRREKLTGKLRACGDYVKIPRHAANSIKEVLGYIECILLEPCTERDCDIAEHAIKWYQATIRNN